MKGISEMARTARRCKEVEGIQGCVLEREKAVKENMAGWSDERAGRRYEITPAQKLPQETN